MTSHSNAEISDVRRLGPFSFRWPTGTEDFEQGWECNLRVGGAAHQVRHGLGARVVYGRERVHTVTWLDGGVQVEGVEADDCPVMRALVSLLKRPDKKFVRSLPEVPAGYEGFDVVDHRREIDAPYSKNCLAVKIVEDDLESWAHHAWLRSRLRTMGGVSPVERQVHEVPRLPAPPTLDQRAVVGALLAHGEALADELAGGPALVVHTRSRFPWDRAEEARYGGSSYLRVGGEDTPSRVMR